MRSITQHTLAIIALTFLPGAPCVYGQGAAGRTEGSKDCAPPPPGMDEPGIDVMWSVVPDEVVKDNYGRYIAQRYYEIEIAIGNNSGCELFLATVGFKSGGTGGPVLMPALGYKMVRGSLERAQELGARSEAVNAIKAIGLMATGITPFFHNAGVIATYSKALNLFSDPFEKGFELVIPDRTTRYLNRLDDQALRADGKLITNNHQEVIRVFVGKASLYYPVKIASHDPGEVRTKLGGLVLVGDLLKKMQFVPRIHTAAPAQGADAKSNR